MSKEIKTVVAAALGFDVVTLRYTRPVELAYDPIIAWVVTAGCEEGVRPSARPVCADQENNGPNESIRLPDGDIVFSEGRRFAKGSEAEALANAIEQRRRRLDVRAAWDGTDAAKPIRTQPIQEQQYGSNIDSLPIEHNTSAPVGSGVVAQESEGEKDRVRS